MIPALPDATGIAIGWLLAHSDVVALIDDRVWPRPAPQGDDDFPYLTVRRIGGVAEHHHAIDHAQLEVAGWSYDRPSVNGDPEAQLVCETAIAALHEAADSPDIEEITDVSDVEAPHPVADPIRDRPRYVGAVLVTIVPLPDGGGS